MIKLTRLNQHVVAINPDNVLWADASPDTTLCLTGGEKLLVRESLDELIMKVVAYQRTIHEPPTLGEQPAHGTEFPPGSHGPSPVSGLPSGPPSVGPRTGGSGRFRRPDTVGGDGTPDPHGVTKER